MLGRAFRAILADAGLSLLSACATPPAALPSRGGSAPAAQTAETSLRAVAREEGSPLLKRLSGINDGIDAKLIPGNRATLLIDGPQTHAAMLQAMATARRSIHLEVYIFEESEEFSAMLLKKRAAGVEVSVLYDSVGSITTPPAFFQKLGAAGVKLCEFNPVNPLKAQGRWTLNNRDHRKLLVVDGKLAFTGGVNISKVYSRGSFSHRPRRPNPDEGWRDTHVQVEGPVVADFQSLFKSAWESQRCPPLVEGLSPVRTATAGDQAMRVVAADPGAGRSEFYVSLLLAMANAGSRIWLTNGYFVPDQAMIGTLIAARRRGVDVRLVLPGFSDFWAPLHAGRSHYEALLAAGIRIFERRDALLHAKTAVIDGVWSSVGSTNLDWRSFVTNYEADVIVFDRAFATELERLFALDQVASQEIALAEWQRRGPRQRFLEWLARWWEKLL